MPEALGHYLDRFPGAEERDGACVPQVVQGERGDELRLPLRSRSSHRAFRPPETGSGADTAKRTVEGISQIERRSERGGEYELVTRLVLPKLQAQASGVPLPEEASTSSARPS